MYKYLLTLLVVGLSLQLFSQRETETLFYDNFVDNRTGWTLGSSDERTYEIKNGKFHFETRSGRVNSTSIPIDESRDFIIETKIDKVSGVQDYGFGLVWGRHNSDNEFEFNISANGYYRIVKFKNGEKSNLESWTTTDAINKWNGATNTLAIKKIGNYLSFYINNQFITEKPYEPFMGDMIGFVVFNQQKIAVHYLKVAYLSDKDNDSVVLFRDDFNDNKNDWSLGGGPEREFDIRNGYFHLQHKRESGSWINSTAVDINENEDFSIEARIRKVSGSEYNGYGIVWGRKNSQNMFDFTVSASGSYRIIDWNDGDFEMLSEWTPSDAINKGQGAFNTFRVAKKGSTLYFYINNELLTTTAYRYFYGEYIGFIAYDNQEIAIDYLVATNGGSNPKPQPRREKDVDANLTTVFYDDFNDNNNDWSLGDDNTRTFSIRNGKFYFNHKLEDYSYINSQYVNLDESKDFAIEAQFNKISGVQNNGFGLVWGRENSQNQYDFTVTGNGYFEVMKIKNGEFEELQGWTKSSYINQGNGATNKLTVKKLGNQLKFYINDYYVTATNYGAAFGNYLGFVVYDQQEVSIDYLDVSYIDKEVYNAPPVITITEPQISRGFDIVPAEALRVEGYAEDSDGISKVLINGRNATVNGRNFTALVPVNEGENKITVVAYDNKNMQASKTFTVQGSVKPIVKEKRLALIVGNAAYTYGGSLANPLNDANDMESSLKELGFDVIKHTNCDQSKLKRAIDEFGARLDGYDVALFFYAGHGIQVKGKNYLVPIDAQLRSENDVEYDCVDASRVLAKMENAGAKANLVILDACRDNPFERSWSRSTTGGGLAFMNAPQGSIIAYATSPGTTASDGRGSNGLYTSALLQHIKTPGISIETVFKRVRATVIEQSGGKQTPWESTSLTGDFYFKQ